MVPLENLLSLRIYFQDDHTGNVFLSNVPDFSLIRLHMYHAWDVAIYRKDQIWVGYSGGHRGFRDGKCLRYKYFASFHSHLWPFDGHCRSQWCIGRSHPWVEPMMGEAILGICFAVVIIGGMGSFMGAIIGGVIVGLSQSLVT